MKGLDIEVNDQKQGIGVVRGTIVLLIETNNGMSITGSDTSRGLQVNWNIPKLNDGDKIKIMVSEKLNNLAESYYTKMHKSALLEEYYRLEKLLKDEGKIK